MDRFQFLINDSNVFLNYFENKYPVAFRSNFFLRDLQYAITNYFLMKDIKIGISEGEEMASRFADELIKNGLASRINKITWVYLRQNDN